MPVMTCRPHDRGNGRGDDRGVRRRIAALAALAPEQDFGNFLTPRKASDMRRENSIDAALHIVSLVSN